MPDQAPKPPNKSHIHTEGGAYVDGSIHTGGGAFIGRDQNTYHISAEEAYNVHGSTNPYLGLRAFTYADQGLYAGREQTAQAAVEKLTTPSAPCTLLFITGASGSGKSSFVQAALLPKLESHYQKYSKVVRPASFRPSQQPMVLLQDALLQLHPAAHSLADLNTITPANQINVLIIDQFEEAFIQSETAQRNQLFELLTTLPPFDQLHTHIIATLRADYLNELFADQALWTIAKQGVELRAMSANELHDAIQKPVQVHHPYKRVAPDLLARLVNDASDDPALLPLLQVTLVELWKKGSLTSGAYENLTHAFRQHAEHVYLYTDHAAANPYQERPPADRAAILGLFLDLVHVAPDEDDRRDVRQRRTRSALEKGSPPRHSLIEELINARLLAATTETLDNQTVEMVEIIHETLIRNWDRLRQAIAAQRRQLQQRARFQLWLGQWVENNRKTEYLLLTNVQLAEARALDEQNDIELQDPTARDFYYRSVEHQEAEQRRQLQAAQARARRLRRLAVGLGIVTLLALLTSGFAFYQTRLATGANLAFQARDFVTDKNLRLATLLALEAQQLNQAQSQQVLDSEIPLRVPFIRWKPLIGHTGSVESVAWRPDGQQLASASTDKTIILWDATSGQVVRILYGHTDAVLSVAWRPDGQQMASTSLDGTTIIWNPANGQAVRTLYGHADAVSSISWRLDGQLLATASLDGTIILWNTVNGKALKTLRGHTDRILSVAWRPDGQQLASVSSDKTVILWDVRSGKRVRILHGHTDEVLDVAWRPDGQQLASASLDGTIILWNAINGQPVQTLHGHTGTVLSVAWRPDGQQLASASNDKTVILWDTQSGQIVRTLHGHTDQVLSVAWRPDGQQLASASLDKTVILWDVKGNQTVSTLREHTGAVWRVAWRPDDQQLASASDDKNIMLWDAATGQSLRTLHGHTDAVESVAWRIDGQQLASASRDKTIIVWDISSGQAVRILHGHTDRVLDVAWRPDGQQLASASKDKTIILWDAKTGQALKILHGHTDTVWGVAWRPDGQQLASASNDKTIILWDVKSGQAVQTLHGHTDRVLDVAWRPDGQQLASASTDKTIILWDVKSGQAVQTLRGHTGHVLSVTWRPDGQQLASSSDDKTIILWDTTNGEIIHILRSHTDQVLSVAWQPDGQQLASGSVDSTIQLHPLYYLEKPCTWAWSNLTLDEWTHYHAWTLYHPTCPDYPTPLVPSIAEAVKTRHFEYLLLSLQGWLFLIIVAIVLLFIVVLQIWSYFYQVRRFILKFRQGQTRAI